MEKFKHLLSKNPIFIKGYTPYDFTRNMGQLAVEIKYTCGYTDMLTTPSTKENVSDKGDFSVDEYYTFLTEIKKHLSNN